MIEDKIGFDFLDQSLTDLTDRARDVDAVGSSVKFKNVLGESVPAGISSEELKLSQVAMRRPVPMKMGLEERQRAMKELLENLNEKIGVLPEEFVKAFGKLDVDQLKLPPNETIESVIEELGLDGPRRDEALKLYGQFVSKVEKSSSKEKKSVVSPSDALAGASIAASGLGLRPEPAAISGGSTAASGLGLRPEPAAISGGSTAASGLSPRPDLAAISGGSTAASGLSPRPDLAALTGSTAVVSGLSSRQDSDLVAGESEFTSGLSPQQESAAMAGGATVVSGLNLQQKPAALEEASAVASGLSPRQESTVIPVSNHEKGSVPSRFRENFFGDDFLIQPVSQQTQTEVFETRMGRFRNGEQPLIEGFGGARMKQKMTNGTEVTAESDNIEWMIDQDGKRVAVEPKTFSQTLQPKLNEYSATSPHGLPSSPLPLSHVEQLDEDIGGGNSVEFSQESDLRTQPSLGRSDTRDLQIAESVTKAFAATQLAHSDTTGDPNVNEVVQRAQFLARGGGGEMRIQLSPPDLGQVDLRVILDRGQVQVEMITETQEAKKILEKGLSELKSSLAAHRIHLDDVKIGMSSNVSEHMERNFENHQEQQQRQNAHDFLSQFRDGNNDRRGGMFEDRDRLAFADHVRRGSNRISNQNQSSSPVGGGKGRKSQIHYIA